MSKAKTTITKLDLLNAPIGHRPHASGMGVHRDKRKQPKGGRNATNRRAINEF